MKAKTQIGSAQTDPAAMPVRPKKGTPEYVLWARANGGGRRGGVIPPEWQAVLPPKGSRVYHPATGDTFTVIGYKNEGSDRGYALKVEAVDGGERRHLQAYNVELIEEGAQ